MSRVSIAFLIALLLPLVPEVAANAADAVRENTAIAAQEDVVCEHDVCFERFIEIENQPPLSLRGVGLYEWLFFDIYTAAYYANESVHRFTGASPARLVLRYHRSISADTMRLATEWGLERRPSVDAELLRERLQQLYSEVYRPVREGDLFTVTYLPGSGTHFEFNGRRLAKIAGADFARFFFGMWLSERYNLDPEYREHLMGLR